MASREEVAAQIRAEILARAKALATTRIKRESAKDKLSVNKLCFGPQKSFVKDPSRFKNAVCTRRAGKTMGAAIELLDAAERKPGAPVLYFTLTRGDAKRIIWDTLKYLNQHYNLGYEPNEAELVLKKNGKGIVYLTGVNTKSELEKMRGSPWAKVVGDEAQSLPAYVKDLIEEVLTPALMDYDGSITLIGTPGPVPVGYFYDISHSSKWSHHAWTVWQNPHIPNPRGVLNDILEMRGVTEEDPKIQREWFGKWTYDPNSLVFRYDAHKNHYDELPLVQEWKYVIGVDLGFNDADAIAVLGWSPTAKQTWLVEEYVQDKSDITTLAGAIESIWNRLGRDNVLSMVLDSGGLGRKINEELSARFKLPITAAQKHEKQTYIELLNDAMRTSKFLAKRTSRFAHDSMLVEWDKEHSTPDRRAISDRFHSDIADAVLYAFRESLAWLSKEPRRPPEAGTRDAYQAAADELFRKTMQEVEKAKMENPFEFGTLGIESWEGE